MHSTLDKTSRPAPFAVLTAAALLASGQNAQAQTTDQFRTEENRIVVGSRSHWEDWAASRGTVDITPDGEVAPRRWKRHTDATDDIVEFMRYQIEAAALDPTTFKLPDHLKNKSLDEVWIGDAVVAAGSNPEGVVNILDGDLSTFWEPEPLPADVDRAAVPALWWFTVDLGRLVFLNRIVLRFVDGEEVEGDPFLLFDVLVADGRRPVSAPSRNAPIEYFPVYVSLQPNRTGRVTEIDLAGLTGRRELGGEQDETLSRQREFEEDGEGEEVMRPDMATLVGRYVQVVIRGSALGRAQEVTPAQYDELAAGDRGSIDYFKRLPGGDEIEVPEEVYLNELGEEERGSVRRYRRERPRLAEVEVWGEGDDVAHGTLRRGGALTSPDARTGGILLDGDVETAHTMSLHKNPEANFDPTSSVFLDLGSSFWLEAQRMTYVFSRDDAHTFGDYTLQVSDGATEADGSLEWSVVVDREQTETVGGIIGRITEGNNFDPVAARFLKLEWPVKPGTGNVHTTLSEFQLFGSGYQPRVTLTSGRIPLGGSKNLVSIEWDADTPPGTDVQLQTRTGDTFTSDTLYYHGDNIRLYEGGADEYYLRKNRRDRGDKIGIWIDGPEWEPGFSAPYQNPEGSPVTSPSPRGYARLRATLLSDDPGLHAALREVRLNFADPVARRLTGEISPATIDRLGEEIALSLYVRADTLAETGFDQLLLAAPADMLLSYRGLYAGSAERFAAAGSDLSGLEVAAEVLSDGSDSLHVSFPAVTPGSGVELLRLDLAAALFTVSAPLKASLRLGDRGFWQRVDPGDAAAHAGENDLTLVAAPERRRLFGELTVSPPLFTPNADGANDVATLSFDVLLVRGSTPVEAHLFDLGGRRVRVLSGQRPVSTGSWELRWDGRGEGGELVPPGVYTVLLKVDADVTGAGLDRTRILRTVAVVY